MACSELCCVLAFLGRSSEVQVHPHTVTVLYSSNHVFIHTVHSPDTRGAIVAIASRHVTRIGNFLLSNRSLCLAVRQVTCPKVSSSILHWCYFHLSLLWGSVFLSRLTDHVYTHFGMDIHKILPLPWHNTPQVTLTLQSWDMRAIVYPRIIFQVIVGV